jgi:hypothetical protein
MSPEQDLSTSVAVVRMAGDDGRLIFFADLRSDVVEAFREDENDFERTVVALAIEESDAVLWEWKLTKRQTLANIFDFLEDDHPPGPGRPSLVYQVVWLDKDGQVVEDFGATDDLEEAKSLIDQWPGATWEPLATDANVAKAFVTQRLVASPHDGQ